jgi:hypothetical protein
MRVGGAYADLDQVRGELVLHDPGERRSMAQGIAAEIVVKVRVSVEMENGDGSALVRDAADDRKSHHMIAAEEQRRRAIAQRLGRTAANPFEIAVALVQRQIARILNQNVGAELEPGFARLIGMVGGERGADRGGRRRGSAQERRMAVGRQPDQPNARLSPACHHRRSLLHVAAACAS